MAVNTIECPMCGISLSCDDEHIGVKLECPSCGGEFRLVGPDGGGAETAASSPVSETPAATASPKLPERMKANRLLDGRVCPKCRGAILFGEDVHNCQVCGQTLHESCWGEGGCPSPQCRARSADETVIGLKDAPLGLKKLPSSSSSGSSAPPEAESGDTKECRFCGELILPRARKCRFCGEFQDEKDRKPEPSGSDDEALTGGEIALGVICSGIACIVGIVWICQGKKKGWKLLMISLVVQAVLAMIRAAAR